VGVVRYGLRKLVEHVWAVVGVASACQSMTGLKYRMARRFGKQPVQYLLFIGPPRTLPDA
jgi:hypothetical protein